MAAVASTFAPTVTVRVYKNGNRNFLGKTLVINRRHIRTMDALYDQLTAHISAFNAVRKICTPIGGRPVHSLESIRNKNVYVAAGREEFKKLNYADLGVSKPRPPRKTNISPKKTVVVTEGRHKMDYEWGKRDLKILYVFCNGDVFKPKVKIVLQKRLQQSMEQILNIVQEHVFLAAAIAALYTKDGKLVLTPADLVTGGDYVAVERGRCFKRMNYGEGASSLSRSPRAPFLPQIGNGQLTNTGRLPRIDKTKLKPRVTKNNIESKGSEQLRDQSRVTNLSSVTSPHDVIRNSSPDPPTVHGLLQPRMSQDLESMNNFTISTSPPGWLEDDTPVEETTLVKTENDEDDTLTIGNVFKASGLMQEKADEVKDTRQTKEEKPIDLLPAEEIIEEVLEQVENTGRKISFEEDQDERKENKRTEDEHEDEIETIEDASNQAEVAENLDQSQMQAWENDEPEDESELRPADEGANKNEKSRQLSIEDSSNSTASSETHIKKAIDDSAPSEPENKDGGVLPASSSADKAVSTTADENNDNTLSSSEPEKSEDHPNESEEGKDEVNSGDDNVAKSESENQTKENAALDSNNNEVPGKGASDSENT